MTGSLVHASIRRNRRENIGRIPKSVRYIQSWQRRTTIEADNCPMPSSIIAQRMTARMDSEFCVFLIGMRINRLLKVHKWFPVFLAMPRMLRELESHKELGFLG